ncbi:MAG: HisS family protein [Chloroflexota bacterium]
MIIQRCKGSKDLCPEEMTGFRLVEDTFRDSCLKWGYGEVRTPTLEYLHLFTSTGTLTPAMLGKVYSFLDWDGWSGERVVLRPDGTIPVARLYIDNLAGKGLAKLFYVTNVFIFEPTGKESREKWQCGAELIGGDPRLADIELMLLALEVLRKLGIKDINLRISHAGVIRAILKKARLSPEEEVRIFDRILDGDAEALAGLGAKRPELEQILPLLLNLKGKSSGFLKNMKALLNGSFPEMGTALDDFIGIAASLEELGISYQIDVTSGRGLEYYTGIMFQLYSGEERVGGGGRYDALIPLMGGADTTASGFALYQERLMSLLSTEVCARPAGRRVLVRTSPDALRRGLDVAGKLREAGYVAEFYHSRTNPKEISWLVDVGEDGLVLTDIARQKNHEFQSAGEILAFLRESGRK